MSQPSRDKPMQTIAGIQTEPHIRQSGTNTARQTEIKSRIAIQPVVRKAASEGALFDLPQHFFTPGYPRCMPMHDDQIVHTIVKHHLYLRRSSMHLHTDEHLLQWRRFCSMHEPNETFIALEILVRISAPVYHQ